MLKTVFLVFKKLAENLYKTKKAVVPLKLLNMTQCLKCIQLQKVFLGNNIVAIIFPLLDALLSFKEHSYGSFYKLRQLC